MRRRKSETRGETDAAPPGGEPKVVVCAWCRRGEGDAAARCAGTRLWEAVSRAFVRAVERAGLASHGICPACRAATAAEFGADPGG